MSDDQKPKFDGQPGDFIGPLRSWPGSPLFPDKFPESIIRGFETYGLPSFSGLFNPSTTYTELHGIDPHALDIADSLPYVGIPRTAMVPVEPIELTESEAAAMEQVATLTMEKLQETINKIGSTIMETYERANYGGGSGLAPLPFPPGVFGMPIRTDPYLGDAVYPQPPAMPKGPYLKRRIKRWHRAHPSYTVGNGKYWLVNQSEVWCHPDDFTTLQQNIKRSWEYNNQVRPADSGGKR